jgi:hypothetical protein
VIEENIDDVKKRVELVCSLLVLSRFVGAMAKRSRHRRIWKRYHLPGPARPLSVGEASRAKASFVGNDIIYVLHYASVLS